MLQSNEINIVTVCSTPKLPSSAGGGREAGGVNETKVRSETVVRASPAA